MLNAHIGRRVRLRRHVLGLSQRALAEALGVRFPQVQKYESGVNRIASDRLADIARVLDVPISYFFVGMTRCNDGKERNEPDSNGWITNRESMEVLRAYYALPGDSQRRIRMLMAACVRVIGRYGGTDQQAGTSAPETPSPMTQELATAFQIAANYEELVTKNLALAEEVAAAMNEILTLMENASAAAVSESPPGDNGEREAGPCAVAGVLPMPRHQ